jgi:hypothetical protein
MCGWMGFIKGDIHVYRYLSYGGNLRRDRKRGETRSKEKSRIKRWRGSIKSDRDRASGFRPPIPFAFL